jgi:hypothetical protein
MHYGTGKTGWERQNRQVDDNRLDRTAIVGLSRQNLQDMTARTAMTGRTDQTWKWSARYFYLSIDLLMKYTRPGLFFSKKYFTKSMYLLINYIFSVHSFSKNVVKSFKNAYICKKLFKKLLYCSNG